MCFVANTCASGHKTTDLCTLTHILSYIHTHTYIFNSNSLFLILYKKIIYYISALDWGSNEPWSSLARWAVSEPRSPYISNFFFLVPGTIASLVLLLIYIYINALLQHTQTHAYLLGMCACVCVSMSI